MASANIWMKCMDAAQNALHLPNPKNDSVNHELGTVFWMANPEAFRAAMTALLQEWRKINKPIWMPQDEWEKDDARANCLDFPEYVSACQALARKTQYNPSDPGAALPLRRFAEIYHPEKYEPTYEGWLQYVRGSLDLRIRAGLSCTGIALVLPEDDFRLNSYTVATSESGKTELAKLRVHSYVTQPNSSAVVVIDPSGDFSRQVARFKDFVDSDRLVYITPLLRNGYKPTINLFDTPVEFDTEEELKIYRTKLAAEMTDNIAKMLADESEMRDNMRAVCRKTIRALLDVPGADFRAVKKVLRGEKEWMEKCRTSKDKSARDFFEHDFDSDTMKYSREGVINKLNSTFLGDDIFLDLTCGPSTINLTQLLDEKKVIVFDTPKGGVGAPIAVALGRMVLTQLVAIAQTRVRIPKIEDRPLCHIFIDEFQNYVTSSVFEAINEARKYRFRWNLLQPGAYLKMNNDQRQTVKTNVKTIILGRSGEGSVSELAKDIKIDESDIANLQKGEFYMKTDSRPAFRFAALDHLADTKHSMSDEEWARVEQRMIDQGFYRRDEPEPEPTPKPKGKRKLQ